MELRFRLGFGQDFGLVAVAVEAGVGVRVGVSDRVKVKVKRKSDGGESVVEGNESGNAKKTEK